MKLTPRQITIILEQLERRRVELEPIDCGKASEIAQIISRLGEEYMELIQ